jgi:Mn-dependent DtxR family transcriptional regulator
VTGGRLLQGRMLMTVAQRLGVPFDQAHQMAEAAAKAGLVDVVHSSSVTLTEKGRRRGATLKPPKAG